MRESLALLFDTSDFPARWHCGNWSDAHGWTHVISDAAIFGAYVAIPIVLAVLVLRRRDVPFPRVFWLFGLFIFSCGTTHLLEVIIFWHPLYRVSAAVKVVTAVASWATVLALVPTVRVALQLRSPAALEAEVQARTEELTAQRDKNAQLAAVVGSSHDVIISKDRDGIIRSWNAAAARTYGYTEAEACGQHISLIVPEDLRPRLDEILAQVRAGEPVHEPETRRIDREGRIHVMSISISPVVGKTGEVIGASAVARDETEVHESRAQLATVNAQLVKKNEELEQFVYTVSHDLKSPLVTAAGFLSLTRQALAGGDAAKALSSLARVERAAVRMNALIKDLLELSRAGGVALDPREQPLALVVEAAQAGLRDQLEAVGAEVVVGALPSVPVDAGRAQQVFENLLGNAVKYRSPKRPLRVEIGWRAHEGEQRVFVRDNGLGIEAKHHRRIFGVFERLDVEAEGTGIGLAIVSRVMDMHGGRAWVESAPGEGSTFWLAFGCLGVGPEAEVV